MSSCNFLAHPVKIYDAVLSNNVPEYVLAHKMFVSTTYNHCHNQAILWGLKSLSSLTSLLSLWAHNSIHNSLWATESGNMIWQISISDSPLCLGDSWESNPSLNCSHIPVIVHSPTGRLCSSATSHHSQPCRAASAQPWGRRHRPWHSLRYGRRPWMRRPQTLQAPPDVFWFWQERGSRGWKAGDTGGWGYKPRGLFATLSGVAVCRKAGRLSGNERGQLAGSAEVNS